MPCELVWNWHFRQVIFWIHCDLTFKSDTRQHSQFLQSLFCPSKTHSGKIYKRALVIMLTKLECGCAMIRGHRCHHQYRLEPIWHSLVKRLYVKATGGLPTQVVGGDQWWPSANFTPLVVIILSSSSMFSSLPSSYSGLIYTWNVYLYHTFFRAIFWKSIT